MRLEIRRRGLEVNEALRSDLERRLHGALGRLSRSIGDVWVYLRRVNGPRGGAGKKCRILVRLPRIGNVVVTGAAAEVFGLVRRTAERVGHAVRRRLGRRRDRRRPGRGDHGGRGTDRPAGGGE